MKRRLVSGIAAVFLFALAGCGGAVIGVTGDCRTGALCPAGTLCSAADGFCYATPGASGCVSDFDCGPDAYCASDGVCYTVISGCQYDAECAPGYVCGGDGLCYSRNGCSYDSDCAEGFYCASDGNCYHI